MIIDPGYLLDIPTRLGKIAIINDQALRAVTLFTTVNCQLNELHTKQPQDIPPAYSRVILHAVEYILFCLDMRRQCTACQRMHTLYSQKGKADQAGKYRLEAVTSLLKWSEVFTHS